MVNRGPSAFPCAVACHRMQSHGCESRVPYSLSLHPRLEKFRFSAPPNAPSSASAYKPATCSQSTLPLLNALRASMAANASGCIGGMRSTRPVRGDRETSVPRTSLQAKYAVRGARCAV